MELSKNWSRKAIGDGDQKAWNSDSYLIYTKKKAIESKSIAFKEGESRSVLTRVEKPWFYINLNSILFINSSYLNTLSSLVFKTETVDSKGNMSSWEVFCIF